MHKHLPFLKSDIDRWDESIQTPYYVYNEEGIRSTVRDLYRAFAWNNGFKEYFAVKATPTPAILRLLAKEGCGADTASESEVLLSTRSGIKGNNIIFSSNETSINEYKAAYKAGAIINLDDLTQVENMYNAIGVPKTVCCRYNPGQFQITGDIMGHLNDSKFGMPKDQLFTSLLKLKEYGVETFGIHAMLSSNSLNEEYYPTLARTLFELVLEIKSKLDIQISFVDFAGGIGIPYKNEENPVDIIRIGEEVRKIYNELLTPAGIDVAIYTELARFITGPHGYLITKVIGEKHTYREYVGVDATACCLMRPAIYGAYHHIFVMGKEEEKAEQMVDVVGSLCENNDKFAINRELPKIEIGDVLAICDAGAHGHSMGYNYNGKLRPAEYLMNNKKELKLIRRAQTVDDLFATLDIDEEFMR